MKKTILSKKTWVLAMCAFILTSLLYVACSKDNAAAISDSKDKPPVETIDERISRYENVTYEHFRYFSSTKPEEYLPEPIREDFMDSYKKASEKYQGLEINTKLERMKNDNIISEISKNKLQTLANNFKNIGSNQNFYDNAINLLNDNMLSLKGDKNLTNKDLDLLIVVLAQSKGYLRYSKEVEMANSLNNISKGLNIRCDPNERETCRLNMMLGGGVIGLAWGPIGGLAGALIGGISGIFACCSVGGTSCEKPTFALNNFNCTDNSCVVTAMYSNGAQRNTEFNPPQGGTIEQILNNVSVRIKQTGLSPVSMDAFVLCDDGIRFRSNPFIVDIMSLANNPGFVSLSGPSNGNANNSSTYFFSSRLPENTTYQIELTGSIGTAIQTWNNAVTIRWFRTGTGTIRIKAINTCSGQAVFSDIINLIIQ